MGRGGGDETDLVEQIDRLAEALPSPDGRRVLRERERLAAFLALLRERNSVMNLVSARSAAPEELVFGHLADALSQVAGHAVEVRLTVDPSVLGGFVATMGDTVVDGSTRHRLDLLKERLIVPEAEITT